MMRRLLPLAFASACALWCPADASAQRLQFKKLTAENGLTAAWVNSIYQDSRGFMWFGTHNGLNRFDAYNVTTYRHRRGDSTSLVENYVEFIKEDRDSALWIGTRLGLTRFDRDRETFRNYVIGDGQASRPAYTMVETRAGALLLGTDAGLYKFDRATGKAAPYAPQATVGITGELGALFEDRRGHIWVASHGGGLADYDPASNTTRRYLAKAGDPNSLPDNDIRAAVEDSTGAIWIGTYHNGLVRLDPVTGVMTRFQHEPGDSRSLSINSIQTLALNGSSGLWIGTDNGGLDRLDVRTNAITHNSFDANDEMGLNSASIWSLLEDHEGTLWVGTFSGGVNMGKRNSDGIRSYHSVPGDLASLSMNSVVGFAQDSAGYVWVATDGGGLNRFDPSSKRFTRFTMKDGGVNRDAVLAVAAEPNGSAVWVGTWDGGISRIDPSSHTFTAYTTKNSNIPSDNIFGLHIDRAGRLWVGTWKDGLLLFNRDTKSFTRYPMNPGGLNQSQIWAIEELRDGRLALGTLSQGLRIFDPATGKMLPFQADARNANSLSSDDVRAVREGEPGILWLGTSEGLDRLDLSTRQLTHFGAADGILATAVSGIAVDANGLLWLSTDQGVTRFDPATKQGSQYTVADGLQGRDFTPRAYLQGRGGTIYFGGNQGFSIVRPASMVGNTIKPPVVLTGFDLFNKPAVIGARGSPLTRSISESKELKLAYNQSVFTIEFAALDYTAPAKNQYAYKLEGFDKDWRDAGHQRNAAYTNLAPGSYVFRVKGSNNDGVWNDEGASIRLVVTPPFWQTWWFRLLALAAIGAAVYYVVKSVTARRKNLELMNKQLAEVAERDRKSQQYLAGNVREMLGAMGRFSEGDLSVNLATGTDDEIGQLRVGFNTAVANIRAMVTQVHEIVTATARASQQIQQSTEALAVGAAEQTHQTSLMASAAEEMTATVADNARHIGAVAEMAQQSGRDAQKGGGVVRDTFSSMDTIVSTVALSAKTVSALGDSSKQITSITRVIDELADQTNLLALNAAIEAARAGVHGRTFAVVAEEIRDLADRTSSSTKAIAKLIQENDRAVTEAVDRMDKLSGHLATGRHLVDQAGVALDAIIENSGRVLESVRQVTESSEEQAATTIHIGKNIETISRVSRENAAGNQAIASSVQEMNALIEHLQTRVARFRINGAKNEAK